MDKDGSNYIAGRTKFAPPYNVFITKWSADGSRVFYATHFGGSGADLPSKIAIDSDGNAYIVGVTTSPDFPVTPNAVPKTLTGSQNAFAAKLRREPCKS